HFLNHTRYERRLVEYELAIFEMVQHVPELAGHRIQSGGEEQDADLLQFFVVERAAVQLNVEQVADDIVLAAPPTLLQETIHVVERGHHVGASDDLRTHLLAVTSRHPPIDHAQEPC